MSKPDAMVSIAPDLFDAYEALSAACTEQLRRGGLLGNDIKQALARLTRERAKHGIGNPYNDDGEKGGAA